MQALKDIIAYLINEYPFKSELSNARLTKLVYLADWHQAINYEQQITAIEWYFDNYGPFVFDIINTVNEEKDLFIVEATTNSFGKNKQLIRLKNLHIKTDLVGSVIKSLEHVIEKTKYLNWADFINLVYSTYPITSSCRYSQLNLVEKAIEYKKQCISLD